MAVKKGKSPRCFLTWRSQRNRLGDGGGVRFRADRVATAADLRRGARRRGTKKGSK
jgi:hypothetical protein